MCSATSDALKIFDIFAIGFLRVPWSGRSEEEREGEGVGIKTEQMRTLPACEKILGPAEELPALCHLSITG